MQGKKLYRSRSNRMVAGVAAGLGNYLEVDPTIIRLLFAFLVLLGGGGAVIYFVMWIIVPEEPAS
jgi:phage shock protein PspC (stress-responsive transcriptional regulator)